MTPAPDITRPCLLSEAEVRELCRHKPDKWPVALAQLRNAGFPEPDPILGLYYGPAIKAFFDRRHMIDDRKFVYRPDGEENFG